MPKPFQRPGSEQWYWDYRVIVNRETKEVRRYTGSADTYEQACDKLAMLRKQVVDERIYGPKPKPLAPVPFAEYTIRFYRTHCATKKSALRDKGILERLKARWDGLSLTEITTERIRDFKAEREEHRCPSTVSQEIQVIKRLFKTAVEDGKLEKNPAATIKRPKLPPGRVKFLEPDQMEGLMAACPPWLRQIVTFARFTGARQGEIAKLRWQDVDFKRGIIKFRDTKNGENGTVPMIDAVRALLESLPRPINPALPVFPVAETPKKTQNQIRTRWDLVVEKAGLRKPCACLENSRDRKPDRTCSSCSGRGIDKFKFHDLRHQFATDLINRDVEGKRLQDLLRHKDYHMSLRYAHLRDSKLAEAISVLDGVADAAKVPQTGTGSSE